MKRTTIVAVGVILVLGIGLIAGLNRYKLALIQTIVENAVVQKAPPNYPQGQIRQVFVDNYTKARRLQRHDLYLERLLKVAQRLEKVQRLESYQVDELLVVLDPAKTGLPGRE